MKPDEPIDLSGMLTADDAMRIAKQMLAREIQHAASTVEPVEWLSADDDDGILDAEFIG